jgi:GalNAc-alpha-(1->4)-GalNAc-alpha-(1->3)-diNAcBac-PP-undecaprenol alpha-1,4-N-acetyl-D-galactosaminyltransferase
MRIAFVIYSMTSGGAERVLSIMANYWNRHNHEVHILTFDITPPFFMLDPEIKVTPLAIAGESRNFIHSIFSNYTRIRILRKTIINISPDIIISFLSTTNILTLCATAKLDIPIIASERTHPRYVPLKKKCEYLRKTLYPFATSIIVQTNDIKQCFPSKWENIHVIPNPVLPPVLDPQIQTPALPMHCITTLCRLVPDKSIDKLIQAFALISGKHPDWTLAIIGDGEEQMNLLSLIKQNNLEDRVFLLGMISNPCNVLVQSEIFAFSSRYEGFPNALCEAMACGLPVVSTDCPSGPSELIRHKENGLLVPVDDIQQMADALSYLISNKKERERFGENAKSILEEYRLEKIMAMWEALFFRA